MYLETGKIVLEGPARDLLHNPQVQHAYLGTSNKPWPLLECILICVGSELLRGKLNTHASHLARRLASIGLSLDEENTVSDELPEIVRALQQALDRFQIILISGGLGPTFDDLTREAAADATGRPLALSQTLLKGIQTKFRRARYKKMPTANARQAYLLDAAKEIPNQVGTAPGQWLELTNRNGEGGDGGKRDFESIRPRIPVSPRQVLVLLPGPPSELYPMLEDFVLANLEDPLPAAPDGRSASAFWSVSRNRSSTPKCARSSRTNKSAAAVTFSSRSWRISG